MREIKFRGKRKHDGEWVYGYYYQTQRGESQILQTVHPVGTWFVDPETVGQFIEHQDKSRADIYEGDIVRNEIFGLCQIVFDTGSCSFKANWVDGHKAIVSHCKHGEVIGNIHDNPELLEAS